MTGYIDVNSQYVNGLDYILESLKRKGPHPSSSASVKMATLVMSHYVSINGLCPKERELYTCSPRK